MTRTNSALVLDGDVIKQRLEAERFSTGQNVHVDWLRFTVQRRYTPTPSVDALFPVQHEATCLEDLGIYTRLHRLITAVPDCDTTASMQAHQLAVEVCGVLGPDFSVATEILKGHDFYRFRWSIVRSGAECGWVGFQASSNNPRQQSQNNTIHVNLYGAACTFGAPGWPAAMARLVDDHKADITRADLALDFFDGYPGGLDRVVQDYRDGLCNVSGRMLKTNTVGDWINGRERSFYLGSKEAGKQTNVYEKGDQLFGVDAGSKWLRFELRYGNKLRVLPSDILRRPSDFFAGASDWHASVLREAVQVVAPEPVTCIPRLPLETAEAEVFRVLRWAHRVAAPTLAACWDHLGDDFLSLVSNQKAPRRLAGFLPGELSRAFAHVKSRFAALESAPLLPQAS